MTSARDLADRFHQRWLARHPFAATMYGIPGYDDLVPDESEEGQHGWRREAGQFGQEADAPDSVVDGGKAAGGRGRAVRARTRGTA